MWREVPLHTLDQIERWKEFTLSSQGLTRETRAKVESFGSGFSFEPRDSLTQNRFILWRVSGEVLELLELSLNYDLTDNALRIHLPRPIKPSLVFVEQKTPPALCVVVATTETIHRFVFEHPTSLPGKTEASKGHPSIFSFVTLEHLQTGSRNLDTLVRAAPQPNILTSVNDTTVALGCRNGSIIVISFEEDWEDRERTISAGLLITAYELKEESIMKRLWSFAGTLQSAKETVGPNEVVGLVAHTVADSTFRRDRETYLFSLCADAKLRVWSLRDKNCVIIKPIVADCSNNTGDVTVIHQQIRLFPDPKYPNEFKMVLFIALEGETQFQTHAGSFSCATKDYYLEFESVYYCKEERLVDFQVSGDLLWTLWFEKEKTILKFCPFQIAQDSDVHDVAMESNLWQQAYIDDPSDIQNSIPVNAPDIPEAFLSKIFYPGRFSLLSIVRGLQAFTGSSSHNGSVASLSAYQLRDEVYSVLESELSRMVEQYAREEGIEGEAHIASIAYALWSRFLSCCIKSAKDETVPLGFHIDPSSQLVCFIKRGGLSFLRNCEELEAQWCLTQVGGLNLSLSTSSPVMQSIQPLLAVTSLISKQLDARVLSLFEEDLFAGEDPMNAAIPPVAALLGTAREDEGEGEPIDHSTNKFLQTLLRKFHAVNQPFKVIELLMNYLQDKRTGQDVSVDEVFAYFDSAISEGIVCGGFLQIASAHFALLRDLFLLVSLLSSMQYVTENWSSTVSYINSKLRPRLSALLKQYYVMVWVARTYVAQSTLLTQVPRISGLNISNPLQRSTLTNECTLPQLYYRDNMAILLNKFTSLDRTMNERTQAIFLLEGMTNCLLDTLCRDNPEDFAVFLQKHGQPLQCQEYIRLVDTKTGALEYLLGKCYLTTGQADKAAESFTRALADVNSLQYQKRLLGLEESELGEDDDLHAGDFELVYLLNVTHLFESAGAHAMAIQFATSALQYARGSVNIQSLLWSIIFKHNMTLQDFDQAYLAIAANPDPSRKMDCVRLFVGVACSAGKGQLVTERGRWPGIEALLEDSLLMKARTQDVTDTVNFYNVLYAFHINRANYRAAGMLMYEYAQRLGTETHIITQVWGLTQLVNALLACLHALKIFDEEFAWQSKKETAPVSSEGSRTPKRKHASISEASYLMDTDAAPRRGLPTKRHSSLVTVADVEKQFFLARSHLILGQRLPGSLETLGNPLGSPTDTYQQLINAGFLDRAISLAQLFKLSLRPVFEMLTKRCLQLQTHTYSMTGGAWFDNFVSEQGVTARHPSDLWDQLQEYLAAFDNADTNYDYHRCVAQQILQTNNRILLPNWLVASYRKYDISSLLEIYMSYDVYEEAAELVLDILKASRLEAKHAKHMAQVWLPYSRIEHLRKQLLVLVDGRTNALGREATDIVLLPSESEKKRYAELLDQINQALKDHFQGIEESVDHFDDQVAQGADSEDKARRGAGGAAGGRKGKEKEKASAIFKGFGDDEDIDIEGDSEEDNNLASVNRNREKRKVVLRGRRQK